MSDVMKKLYYYSEEGYFTGSGYSYDVVDNSTEIPPSGDGLERFDVENNEWSLNLYSLEERKNIKKDEVRFNFYNSFNEGCNYNDFVFDSGQTAIAALSTQLLISKESALNLVTVYDINNVAHDLTINNLIDLLSIINNDYQAKFKIKQEMMNSVDVADSVDELNNIDAEIN